MYYKCISKQQALDADSRAIQQINFTGNLAPDGKTTIFFIIKETNKIILDFLYETVRLLQIYFALINYQLKMGQYNTLNEKLFNSQLNK